MASAQTGALMSTLDIDPSPAPQNSMLTLQLTLSERLLSDETSPEWNAFCQPPEQLRLLNRLQTQTLALVKRQTKARIDQLARQLKILQHDVNERLQGCPSRARANTILRSIPGIGEVAASTILIEMPEIGSLCKKKAASLTGLAPMTQQSGKWQGKARIQGGRKPLRDALYMPALVATKHNPDLRDKYKAMIDQGKPKKVAITAVMRKLIELANTLVKADRKWLPHAS